MNLQGKTAIIPGASRPIGRAIARKLAEHGVNLVLPVFDWPESNKEMEKEFDQKQYPYFSCQTDLRDKKQVEELLKKTSKTFGNLNILVNNIERGGMPILHGSYDHDLNKNQWQTEFSTTLHAKWLLYRSSLPLMKQSGQGVVVNISSIASIVGRSGPASVFFSDGYSAANRAVSSLTEAWAKEAAPEVRVNELMLGLIRSRHGEDTRGWSLLTDKEKKDLHEQILLRKIGTPKDVAKTVLFLINQADYMTGATIRLDGGYTLGGAVVPPIPETKL